MLTLDLPRSALIIIDQLEINGPMSPKQISTQANLPARTVSFALKKLVKQELCMKVPNLSDMRQPIYHLNDERIKNIHQYICKLKVEYGIWKRNF